MKKVLLSLFIVLVLSWSCNIVFAKGADKGKGGGQARQAKGVQKKDWKQQVDANEPGGQGKEIQMRKREQREVRRKEQQKMREMSGKSKGKSKAGWDVNQPPGKSEKGKGKSRWKGHPVEKDTGRGKGHQQQLKMLETQIVHEQAKHLWRVARLNRIRELVTEGDAKTLERIDKLLEKEQQRYDRNRQGMQERRQKILQLAEKGLSKEAQRAIEKGKVCCPRLA